ncbi:sigma-54-dependent Fis family transcriptional regulator [Magnetospirillum sp. 15-1]|uniref:sigma-54-dependent Fis family transcriptional regulator n=1 Tax=Magnetospirillum sp. 15-1 TaxID=1979370 RepID=UPI0018D4EFD6|nr:sigma-54-dependent Fis family transcriptional regulator [Magnetospirillum sp. 15-1]
MESLRHPAARHAGAIYKYTWEPGAKVMVPTSAEHHGDGPEISDLVSCLRFAPGDGRIWFDSERMNLIHVTTLGAMRDTLIDKVGEDTARGLITRMGYASGVRDAALARKVRQNGSFRDAFLVGPQLHTLHGMVAVQPVHLEWNTEESSFYGEWIWSWSCDAEHHLAHFGVSDRPTCWLQLGYATGFTSAFTGCRVIYREVQCRAMGHPHCRIVGRQLEAWDPEEIAAELRALQPETFANRPGTRSAIPVGMAIDDPLVDVVGASQSFVSTCHMLQKVARTSATVLFLGETGVGKSLFARTLHQISNRADKPFVAVNCAAIPEGLVEAELFGVEKGAYTDAGQSRPGRFERANHGTLFLDEVGTLSPTAQAKLLRVLQERELERVGGTATVKIDVRIVAATNEDLLQAVKDGRFREDLLYRLNIFPVYLMPLRDRREDIPLLMDHLARQFCRVHGKHVSGFTNAAIDALHQYDYPGNIRELENLIERAVILVDDGLPIDIDHLFVGEDHLASVLLKIDAMGALHSGTGGARADTLIENLLRIPYDDLEEGLITEAMRRAAGNASQAARLLGLKRSQVTYRLKQMGRGETP